MGTLSWAGLQQDSVGRSHSAEQTGWFTGSEKALGDQYVAPHRQLIKSAALRNVLNYLWLLMDPLLSLSINIPLQVLCQKHAASHACMCSRTSLSQSPAHTSKHESLFRHGSMYPEYTDAWRSLELRCLTCKQFVTVGSYLHSFEGYDRWRWLHALQAHGLIITAHC